MPVRLSTPFKNLPGDLKRDSRVQFIRVIGAPNGMFSGALPYVMGEAPLFDDDITTDYFAEALVINSADFEAEAITVRGAVVADTSTAAFDKTVDIVSETGLILGSIVFPKGQPFTLVETAVSFNLLPGVHSYMLRLRKAVPGDELTLNVESRMLWIDVVNASQIKAQVAVLIGGDLSTGGGAGSVALNNYFDYCSQRNYAGGGPPVFGYDSLTGSFYYSLVKLDQSKFDKVLSWEYEAIGSVLDVPTPHGTSRAALFDATLNSEIAATEVFWTSVGTPSTVFRRVANFGNADFVSGDEFEARTKFECPNEAVDCCHSTLVRIAIYVTLDTSQKSRALQLFMKTGHFLASGFPAGRQFYEGVRLKLPVYPAGTVFAFEDSAVSTAAVPQIRLRDVGLTDTGTAGADDAASVLTFGAVRSRQRSGALALTANNRYIVHTTGPALVGQRVRHPHGFIVVEIPPLP